MSWPHLGAALPALLVALMAPLQFWNLYRIRRLWRRRGAAAIEALLASRGERALGDIRPVSGALAHNLRPGLSGAAVVFKVDALAADGAQRQYDLAFEPGGGGSLKRLAHGIWIAPA